MSTFPKPRGKAVKPDSPPPSWKLSREIFGIVLLTIGLLVLLSVWTYSPRDPSWMNSFPVSATNPGITENVVGIVGATIAEALVWLIGSAAFAVPILIIVQGLRSFREETLKTKVRSLVGGLLMILGLSTLFHFYGVTSNSLLATNSGGGVWGVWFGTLVAPLLGTVGGTIVLCSLLLVSILLIVPFSVATALGQVPACWGSIQDWTPRLSFRWLSFPTRLQWPKPNKPVKINRSLAKREGAFAFLQKKEPRAEPEILDEDVESDIMIEQDEVPPVRRAFQVNRKVSEGYNLPDPLALLDTPPAIPSHQTDEILESQSRILTGAFQNFGIAGKVTEVHPGPVITMYEFEPGPGIKVARIVNLAHDLAMALKATSVRIVAPLPGKSTVGIEVPNPVRETVPFREVLTSDTYARSRSKLTMALGKDIFGRPFVADLRTMPHLLVAGATGAGKSVGLNSMLLSLLFSAHPDEVKLLLIDPKVLELQVYDGIPHLLRPALTDPKSAARGLSWVLQEMERRYRLLAEHGVRNIQSYNAKIAEEGLGGSSRVSQPDLPFDQVQDDESTPEPLPYIVVVIDEFADLMMVAPKEIEEKIARLAQMARASGIHLILATQRPSVDVVTGLIKANFPARIAFQVSSKTDSRTILDANGAEALLGLGDMLYLAPGTGRLIRLHGSYVSDEDVRRVVEYVKAQAGPEYSDEAPFHANEVFEEDQERDEVYEQAREVVLTSGQASASLIQRRLRVGYPRAARMIEQMEEEGLVSAPGRDGRREILGPRPMMQERVG